MCIYGLLSFVITSFEEESLQVLPGVCLFKRALFIHSACVDNWLWCLLQANGEEGSHLIEAACEVLSAPSLAEVFWEMVSQKCQR